jgi:hypothetical protein
MYRDDVLAARLRAEADEIERRHADRVRLGKARARAEAASRRAASLWWGPGPAR